MTESINFNVSVISAQAINASMSATSGILVTVVTGASGSSGSSGTSGLGEMGSSGTSLYATSSGNSGTALYATSAGQAGTSVQSGSSNYSGTALYASISASAGSSGSSVYATSSGNAGTTLYATSSGQAGTSTLSSSSLYSGTSLKATSSGEAGTAMYATSAGNSGTALFAQTFGTGGSVGYIPKFSGSSGITVSQIYDAGTRIGIGTSSPDAQIGLLTLNADPSLYLTSSDLGAIPGIQNSSLCQISGTAAISSTYYYVSGHRRRVELLGTSLSSWQRLGIFAESTELINNSDQRKYITIGQNVYVFHGNNGTAAQAIGAYAQIASTSGYIQDAHGYRNVVRIEPGEGGAATAGGITGCNVNAMTRIIGTSGTATLTGTSYAFNGNSYCSIYKTGYINIPTLCGQKILSYISNSGTAATAIVGLAYGILTGVGAVATSGGLAQIGTAYGAYIANGYGANTGTVGVAYGILIESQTNAGTNYAIKTGTAGSVVFGIIAGTSGTVLVGAGPDGELRRIEITNVVAGNAYYAGTATYASSTGNAGTALYATSSGQAGTSVLASSSNYAGTAAYALSGVGGSSGTSEYASSAGTALYALTAGGAAGTSDYSLTSGTAGYSTSSGNAGTALYATSSGNSGTSLYATSSGNSGTAYFASNIGSAGTLYSLRISGDYMDGTAGSTGKVVNVYYGTAATMGTDGVPNGSIYFQYTA